MSFRVIRGKFHVNGYAPDGDSIRFEADKPRLWKKLKGRKVKLNKRGHAQLRIEAIDTLETHYWGKHQPEQWADEATRTLFHLLGIDNVEWYPSHSRVKTADDAVPGYILTRTTEGKGRPISFVFDNAMDLDDGDLVHVNSSLVKRSVNYKMIAKGLAYPMFYDGLFYDLRNTFVTAQEKVRARKYGVWEQDRTTKYTRYEKLEDLTNDHVMLPKLYRRLVRYMRKYPGGFDPWAFKNDLETKNERVFVLRRLHFTHFDNIVRVSPSGRIRLTEKPEDLIFVC